MTKDEIATAMFRRLEDNLDPALKKRLAPTDLREVLLVLADWVYLERFKAVTEFTSDIVKRKTSGEASRVRDAELTEARDRVKEEKPSFLDALGEIG